ncbi:hypothetical protein GRJ2_002124500 [Grus japonensis]|uniref:Uncharacterized protein n=1 Tax=Grus japonensis TaxID=30415 RepID=A0ABC9XGU6_GRUJA
MGCRTAFLVALDGPGFRKGTGLPAISAFCTCNPLPVLHLHLRQLRAGSCGQAAIEQQRGKVTFPPDGHVPPLKLHAKEMFKTREKPPKVSELPV